MKAKAWIWWVVLVAGLVVCCSCAHVSPKDAPKIARHALSKVGIAYQGIAVAYRTAVELRVAHCKATLPAGADEAARTKCMGELGSEGEITLTMIRVSEIYDESADLLVELEQIFGELERKLPEGGN